MWAGVGAGERVGRRSGWGSMDFPWKRGGETGAQKPLRNQYKQEQMISVWVPMGLDYELLTLWRAGEDPASRKHSASREVSWVLSWCVLWVKRNHLENECSLFINVSAFLRNLITEIYFRSWCLSEEDAVKQAAMDAQSCCCKFSSLRDLEMKRQYSWSESWQ